MKFYRLSLIYFLIYQTAVSATFLAPWYHRDIEIFPEINYRFQTFDEVSTGNHTTNKNGDDHFLTLGTSLNYDIYSAEIEVTTAWTKRQRPDVDNGQITLRYLWMNDIINDPISLTTGLTLRGVSYAGWHDIASFHHGSFESELHTAFGKELSTCQEFWKERAWGLFGIGIANVGSPWLRGDLHFERNWWDVHQIHLFACSFWGLGDNSLHLKRTFKGYGTIQHQSIDLGFGYRYFWNNLAIFEAEVIGRIYARNYPKYAKNFVIKLFLPFWL